MKNPDNTTPGPEAAGGAECEPGLLLPLLDGVFCVVGVVFPSCWLHHALRRRNVSQPTECWIYDLYVIVWLLVSSSMLLCAGVASSISVLRLSIAAIACWRIMEILHIAASILLFRRFRRSDTYTVVSARRALLINALNYFELIALFGALYATVLCQHLRPVIDTSMAALYFSTVTMTTLGYGDYLPITGAARLTALLQSVIGILFIALFLGRVIALLAQPKPS